ncbi:MAG: 1-acyl-sn-glycerol-3-phosphate acyltransferase [Candidatus Rokubacteria bacterium]|nr:1-acyl-sn-glycerol-3-phosphate acyltransferase [Candidatus Rokubacteria bacterium]
MRTPVLDVFRPGFHRACRLYFGLELRGVSNIPVTGPVIITPNHQTYADPPLVTVPVRRPVHYMAWNELFAVPGLAWLIRRLRAFPVELESRDTRAVRAAIRLVKAGEALMIFPEGGRSPDGRVGDFKLGAFRLAVSLNAPVLPVTIAGAHDAWPHGQRLPRRGRVTITYHPLERPAPDADPRSAAQELADRTRAVITRVLETALTPPAPPRG